MPAALLAAYRNLLIIFALIVTGGFATAQVYIFTGQIYEGEPPNRQHPMAGVVVQLFGDEDEWPESGPKALLTQTTTNHNGEFVLEWEIHERGFPYYHVTAVDPPGAISTGAEANRPGYVKNLNVVSFEDIGSSMYEGILFWKWLEQPRVDPPDSHGYPGGLIPEERAELVLLHSEVSELVTEGETARAFIELINDSPVTVEGLTIVVLANGRQLLGESFIEIVEPGAVVGKELPLEALPPGEHQVTIVLDPEEIIPERNKENNQASHNLIVMRREEVGPLAVIPVEPMQLNLPLDLHRRVAQLVEEMRGTELAPGWELARLGERVRPLYRPDVEGIAYFEVEIEPAGFVIVSNGDHDFPIPHWDFTGEPVSYDLERQAQAAGKVASKFYKLDTLYYVAEDVQGEQVASIGTPIFKVIGMNPAWLEHDESMLTTVRVEPITEIPDDAQAQDVTYHTEVSGPEIAPIEFEPWSSWQQLKTEYVETYHVLLEDWQREASIDWEIEQIVRESGEGLLLGEAYRLALLFPNVRFNTSGEGTRFTEVRLLEQERLPPVLEVIANRMPPEGKVDLDIVLTYDNGITETLKFFVASPTAFESTQKQTDGTWYGSLEKPLAIQTSSTFLEKNLPEHLYYLNSGISLWNLATYYNPGSWGSWHFYFAGKHQDQRAYKQINIPATGGLCPSGCGATAWAMLFGWADHQAWNGNNYWKPRWGLYRKNGGAYPAPDADAPSTQTQGINNITLEIRQDINSFCWYDRSGTYPWNMDDAEDYFKNRTGTKLETDYSTFGITWSGLRDDAISSIRDRKTPAIIGTGWFTHYPLAYGYAWRSRVVSKWCFFNWCIEDVEYNRSFYVNQGWGGYKNGWISASTWFVGEIFP